MIEEKEMIMKKTQVFFKEQIIVHIKLKTGFWKRGLITEVSADFFMLDETLEGIQPVFFQEIESIEKFYANRMERVKDGKQ